jgi:hypothetical protein
MIIEVEVDYTTNDDIFISIIPVNTVHLIRTQIKNRFNANKDVNVLSIYYICLNIN